MEGENLNSDESEESFAENEEVNSGKVSEEMKEINSLKKIMKWVSVVDKKGLD